MNENTQLPELLYDALVMAAAAIKKGEPIQAYCFLMDALYLSETQFHYSHPQAGVFREEMQNYHDIGELMQLRTRAMRWFSTFQQDFPKYSISESLPACYRLLFNRVTDSVHLLEQGQSAQAHQMLIQAQQDAEALYLNN